MELYLFADEEHDKKIVNQYGILTPKVSNENKQNEII
jgi:hypothetical protein